MGGDPIPGPLDILRDWYQLPTLEGDARVEAQKRIDQWLEKRTHGNIRRLSKKWDKASSSEGSSSPCSPLPS